MLISTTISTFYSDDNNIANINILYQQIMTTIPSRMLLFKPIIKKPIVINHTFFTTNTFSKMNSFAYNNAIVIQQLYDQIYICLNKTAIKIIYHLVVYNLFSINVWIYLQVMNQQKWLWKINIPVHLLAHVTLQN